MITELKFGKDVVDLFILDCMVGLVYDFWNPSELR